MPCKTKLYDSADNLKQSNKWVKLSNTHNKKNNNNIDFLWNIGDIQRER